MALDIVTSYQGFDHITADQIADFQRGLLGDSCILPVGSKMEVNIQTANQITVADGVVVYDGREIHIPYGTSENVAITSGTQGMMRNDIVCLQYNRDESSGVESVEFVTIAGTPAASDPQDPAYSNLDIRTGVFMSQKPFCRVRLNGTAIEGIDMLVAAFDMGLCQLNEYMFDTGWIQMQLTSSFKNYSDQSKQEYRRIGKEVYLRGVMSPAATIPGSVNEVTITTLPEGFRPTRSEGQLCQGSTKNTWYLTVDSDGVVAFSRYGTTSTAAAEPSAWLPFSFSYSLDE